MTTSNISSKDFTNELIKTSASYLNECSDTFGQLQSIFNAIIKSADEFSEAGKLAAVGFHVARDFENTADVWREEIADMEVI